MECGLNKAKARVAIQRIQENVLSGPKPPAPTTSSSPSRQPPVSLDDEVSKEERPSPTHGRASGLLQSPAIDEDEAFATAAFLSRNHPRPPAPAAVPDETAKDDAEFESVERQAMAMRLSADSAEAEKKAKAKEAADEVLATR